MTGVQILARLTKGLMLPGRHVLVTAHPDDETVSASAVLSRQVWAPTLVQLTDGTQESDPSREAMAERRRIERQEALRAARWDGVTIIDAGAPGRAAYLHVETLVDRVMFAIAGADAVWTHPYEGGHLDHDTAALVVARAVERLRVKPVILEFASYFMASSGRSVFGDFWPSDACPTTVVKLSAEDLARKRAALAAYTSQASILRKFRTPGLEHYRVAPAYDFSVPSDVPLCRWDRKGYLPSTATWRGVVQRKAVA